MLALRAGDQEGIPGAGPAHDDEDGCPLLVHPRPRATRLGPASPLSLYTQRHGLGYAASGCDRATLPLLMCPKCGPILFREMLPPLRNQPPPSSLPDTSCQAVPSLCRLASPRRDRGDHTGSLLALADMPHAEHRNSAPWSGSAVDRFGLPAAAVTAGDFVKIMLEGY
jgi:hypothetical protein